MNVLMITSEWPSVESPTAVPFIVRQVEFLRRAGVEVEVAPFRGARNPARYLAAWASLQKRLHGGKYDLIHAQWGQSALLALPKRLPLVITYRGNDLEGIPGKKGQTTFLGRIQKSVSRQMARYADEVIVVAERLARHLDRPYHIIPSGLNTDLFRPIPQEEARRKLGLPIGPPLVLFAATSKTNPRKRYWLAEAAMAKVTAVNSTRLLVVSGVPHDQIPYYMNACDALLLTSVHEGSPNVVKEALACNVPVVSVDIGDVRARLAGIKGCEVTSDDSPEALGSALTRVLRHRTRVDSRSTVIDLDEHQTTARVIEVYERAIHAFHSSRRETALQHGHSAP